MRLGLLGIAMSLLKIKKFFAGFTVILLIVLMALIGPLIYQVNPGTLFSPNIPPSEEHPLGTDVRGADVLAQLFEGTKNSLYIGVIAALIAITIGLVIGSIAGFKGGLIDSALMLVTDTVLLIPTILLLMFIASLIQVRSFLIVAIIIGVTSWQWFAKAVRSYILSLKQREYIYMSRMAGLSDLRIIIEDIFPNLTAYTLTIFAQVMGHAIASEAGLSMLGIGTTQGTTLGILLFWAQQWGAITLGYWWSYIPPGAIIVAIYTAALLMVTGLDEYLNPRLRK